MTEALQSIQLAAPPTRVAPATWQAFVYSAGSPESSMTINTLANIDAVRFDSASQDNVPAPGLRHSWSTSIGWHATSNWDALMGPNSTPDGGSDPERLPSDKEHRPTITSAPPQPQLRDLVAEVAHDIRAPLAIAKQIVDAVANIARNTGRVESGEVELLDVAKMRLQEANRWAEGILIGRCLEHGTPVTLRRRFYPAQWRQVAEPLLESVAASKNIQLHWKGWDRSLPRLYLDESQLTRVALNLVTNAVQASAYGKSVWIRVGVQNSITQQLTLTIEDEGTGIDDRCLHQFNSNYRNVTDQDTFGTGLGLRTAQALVAANGGDATLSRAPSGGALVRITLPSDNPASLIRRWIVDNAALLIPRVKQRSSKGVKVYAVKIEGVDSEFCDTQLQQSAARTNWVYRVGSNRWIWLSVETDDQLSEMPNELAGALDQIRALQRSNRREQASVHLAFSLKNFFKGAGANSKLTRQLVSELTHLLVAQVDRLTGERVPSVDNIETRQGKIVFRSEHGTRQVRQDVAQMLPIPNVLKQSRRESTAPEGEPGQQNGTVRQRGVTSPHPNLRQDQPGGTGLPKGRRQTVAEHADSPNSAVQEPASGIRGRVHPGSSAHPARAAARSTAAGGTMLSDAPAAMAATEVESEVQTMSYATPVLATLPEALEKDAGVPPWSSLATQFRLDQGAIDTAHRPIARD